MNTSHKLTILRNAENLSQEDLANALQKKYRGSSITRDDIANWETGRHLPGWTKAKYLSRFFGVSLDDLFFEDRTELFKKLNNNKNRLKVAKSILVLAKAAENTTIFGVSAR